jgi:hypothetical protein
VQDLDGGVGRQPTETLQVGSSRPPLLENRWRRPAAAFLAFVVGVAAGGGAVLWWQAEPEPPPPSRPDEHAVELILFEAEPSRTHPGGAESETSPLQVDGAVLLSGLVTSTVLGIGLGDGLDVRAPGLPATVSPTDRFQSVNLMILVRDCKVATQWTPGDRPFTIRWRDDFGRAHLDRAGDFGTTMANSLIRYIDGACASPADR